MNKSASTRMIACGQSGHPQAGHSAAWVRLWRGLAATWMAVATLAMALASVPEVAQAWTPPAGTTGWCTVTPTNYTGQKCFGDAVAACALQHQLYGGSLALYAPTSYNGTWYYQQCRWQFDLGNSLPTYVDFNCEAGYKRVAPGYCISASEDYPSRDCACPVNHGGSPNPSTPFPIDILSGAKSFSAIDFVTSDGQFAIDRTFSSRPFAQSGNSLIGRSLGFGNWGFGLNYEVQIGADWAAKSTVGLLTPRGGFYTFAYAGGAFAPSAPAPGATANKDYTLSFSGTMPSNPSTLTSAPSSWVLRDPQDRLWYLDTRLNARTGKYDVARPTRMVAPDGAELTFTYQYDVLFSIADSHGRRVYFEWATTPGDLLAISKITLPDLSKIVYTYESVTPDFPASPDRLVKVDMFDSSGTLLDETTYDYGDDRYFGWVTGIRDKNGVLRWSVTYDDAARAVTSTGPGGVDAYTVSYGAPGATFTRTVTGPLGKVTTYNFTRTSTSSFDVRLASVVQSPSTASPGATASVTYDAAQFLATSVDPEGRTTGYTRDALGRPTQIVEAQATASARTTDVTWDPAELTPTQVVAPGLTTTFQYTAAASGGAPPDTTTQFAYTGVAQTYTVPSGVVSATIELWGAAGGNGNYTTQAWSGAGGYVRAIFPVSAGDVLKFEVGGGGQGGVRGVAGGAGGWPDGGSGGRGDIYPGGGGGSTRLYINGALKAVAGGGGGSGGWMAAGAGGGEVGQAAESTGGTGGTQSAPGVDSNATSDANKTGRSLVAYPGVQRTGGWGASNGTTNVSSSDDGGGGGGGYWGGGGGGGDGRGGGGGSSWVASDAYLVVNRAGNRQTPYTTPPGQPTVATGVNSVPSSGPVVPGGDGYALLQLR